GPAASTAYTTDLTAASPRWAQTGSMAFPRSFLNLTPLPDGTVLATGGETTKDGTNVGNAVDAAEDWNPASGTWTTLASAARPRPAGVHRLRRQPDRAGPGRRQRGAARLLHAVHRQRPGRSLGGLDGPGRLGRRPAARAAGRQRDRAVGPGQQQRRAGGGLPL